MKAKFYKSIITCAIAMGLALVPVSVFADQCSANVCNGNYPESVKSACGCDGAKKDDTLSTTIQNILNSIIGIAGLIAAIFIVVGGVNYMTSGGDTGKLEKAKKTILYALIGLIVCALAFAIVNFAIGIINNANKP